LTSTDGAIRVHGVGVFVRQHQFIVGAGNQRDRMARGGKNRPGSRASRNFASSGRSRSTRVSVSEFAGNREGKRRQRFATEDPKAAAAPTDR